MNAERHPGKSEQEQHVDRTVEDSFPASDPPSHSGITGAGRPANRSDRRREPTHQRNDDARPTGTPNSDRHAMETAHQWEDETHPQQKHRTK